MPRASTVVTHRGHIAIIIPKKSAERIGLQAGDSVKVFLNSFTSVRVEKVSETDPTKRSAECSK